ncbi:MAG TPA: outer membrane beta-barrel protein [Verrucomicrobiota bacterium]|nr:outer membrane beta-barrel protein [Verrucomicrobiota bacterium]
MNRFPSRTTACCLASLAGWTAWGQEAASFLTTELPYPEYMPVQRDHYNLRWGALTVRLDATLAVSFTDNAYLAENDKTSDWGLTPLLNFGFFYPIREDQTLQLDVGFGYTWWNERDDLSGLTIAPRSHLHFRQRIGEVDLFLNNLTSTQTQPSSRVELAGDQGEFTFSRIYNTASLGAGWRPTRRLGFNAGYSYSLDRGLSDDFSSQDRDIHSLNAGTTFYQSEIIQYGLGASYSFINYIENIQSDAQSLFIGPNVQWRPKNYLTVGLKAGYTQYTPDDNGLIPGAEDFNGFTFGGDVAYQMNRDVSHALSFFRRVDPGFGNDYTEEIGGTYSAGIRLGRRGNLSLRAGYSHADLSSGETADQWTGGVGLGWDLIRRVSTGLNWGITSRDSNLPNRDYVENSVVLRLGYQF